MVLLPLFVTPAIFKPGSSTIKGINPPHNPLKDESIKTKTKEKQKRFDKRFRE